MNRSEYACFHCLGSFPEFRDAEKMRVRHPAVLVRSISMSGFLIPSGPGDLPFGRSQISLATPSTEMSGHSVLVTAPLKPEAEKPS